MVTSPTPHPGEKPDYRDQYATWLRERHRVDTSMHRKHYESAVSQIEEQFGSCPFWVSIKDSLTEIDAKYQLLNGVPLISDVSPKIYRKSYDSFLNKSYRVNVLNNESWPDQPTGGWLLPPDWYSRVGDIVRTTLVVRYLDGVQFLLDQIKELAKTKKVDIEFSLEARPEGYYAAHMSYGRDTRITTLQWGEETRFINFEIQISTGIKQLIKSLIHKYYQDQRLAEAREPWEWQWDYKSDEFIASYLGHVIHYLEGMIVEVRDRQKGG